MRLNKLNGGRQSTRPPRLRRPPWSPSSTPASQPAPAPAPLPIPAAVSPGPVNPAPEAAKQNNGQGQKRERPEGYRTIYLTINDDDLLAWVDQQAVDAEMRAGRKAGGLSAITLRALELMRQGDDPRQQLEAATAAFEQSFQQQAVHYEDRIAAQTADYEQQLTAARALSAPEVEASTRAETEAAYDQHYQAAITRRLLALADKAETYKGAAGYLLLTGLLPAAAAIPDRAGRVLLNALITASTERDRGQTERGDLVPPLLLVPAVAGDYNS